MTIDKLQRFDYAISEGGAFSSCAYMEQRDGGEYVRYEVAQEMYEALRLFYDHYPYGVNPQLDEAYVKAMHSIAKAEGEKS